MVERCSPQRQEVARINTAISATRNEFVGKYRRKMMGSKLLTYEPALDREVYKTLKTFADTPQQGAYEEVKQNLNSYTTFQVETFIGERLNVGLSSFRYDLKDGQMYGQGMDVPLIEMIQRGRDCRDSIADDVDKPRQDAEIEQFQKIESVFTDPQAHIGTTIISVSPPGGEGSAYGHNFYDIFVLSEDKATRERFIEGHRYSSDLSLDEYKKQAETLAADYFAEYQNQPIDSYFLSHPLVIDVNSPLHGKPEEIHAKLHKDHEFLSTEDFSEVRRQIAGLVMSYVNTLVDTPDDKEFLETILNATMNKADAVADSLKHNARRSVADIGERAGDIVRGPVSHAEIVQLGSKPVRQAATGCGSSSGFGEDRTASNMSSTSVRDFGKDSFGNRVFDCPDCGEMNVRPVNQLLLECQHCRSKKVSC